MVNIFTDSEFRGTVKKVCGQTSIIIAFAILNILLVLTSTEAIAQDAVIESDPIEVDQKFIQSSLNAYANARSRQMESLNFSTVISSERLGRFADYSVEDALAHVVGVQAGRRGEINLRGVGYNRYNVTVDGVRMGSTGKGDRGFDLGSISLDMVQEVEVLKVLTPDMDADALSGVVNLITRRQDINERGFSAILGGGGNTRYLDLLGPDNRASLSYWDNPTEVLSLSMNLSYQVDRRGWESLGVGYDVINGQDGMPVDVIDNISPAIQTNGQNRIGGNLRLNYQPNDQTTYHVQTMINHTDRELIRHRNTLNTQGDWITPDNTGNQGTYDYDMQLQNFNIQQHIVQAGAKHEFARINLDYNIGWEFGSIKEEMDNPHFQWSGLEYAINWENRTKPIMEVTNPPLQRDGTVNPRRVGLEHHDRILERHVDNTYSGRVDVEIPFTLGAFKIGSSARFTSKDGFYNDSRYTIFGPLSVGTYDRARYDGIDIFDQEEYRIPIFIDPYSARAFYTGNRPRMQRDDDMHFENSEIGNYSAIENILAGYGMTTLKLGNLSLYGGIRLEHTGANYEGRRPLFDDQGRLVESPDSNVNASYINLFPNAQLVFSLGSQTDIRAAYSRSIARPDYNRLAPFEQIHVQDTTIIRGNPSLDPMVSDNVDLLFEHYYNDSGAFTLGMFYKQLSGFTSERERITNIQEGEFAELDVLFSEGVTEIPVQERIYQNNDEKADIYGLEVSWQQSLTFLPGFLSNFGTYANYTWSQSVLDVDYRDDDVRLPGQSPHVLNAAIDYNQGRFSTQLSYHRTSSFIQNLRHTRSMAPSIDQNDNIYMDRYQDGWSDLSFTFRFRVSNHYQLWADVSNILGEKQIQYAHTRNLYPVESEMQGGRAFLLGVRYDL
ncbi:MAG: TonB-dependent receptor [Balneolales bacterium]